LPVRLGHDLSPGCGVAMLLALVLLCSGVITPLIVYTVSAIRVREFDAVPMTGFFSLFIGIIWMLLVGVLVKEWRIWRMGVPTVEVSALPIHCGEACTLLVTIPGPARMRRLRVAVVCEESVSYTEGTTTRKEARRVFDQELTREEDLF